MPIEWHVDYNAEHVDYIDYDNVRGPEWLNVLGSWIT